MGSVFHFKAGMVSSVIGHFMQPFMLHAKFQFERLHIIIVTSSVLVGFLKIYRVLLLFDSYGFPVLL